MTSRILLGPQRPVPSVGDAVHSITAADETVAVISAGWQEAEADLDELEELIERPLVDLRLYSRTEEVIHDATIGALHGQRQAKLRALQRYYRLRLVHAMRAAVDVLQIDDDAELLKLEQRHAITQLRALDRHHLERVRAAHNEFDAALDGVDRRLLDEQRAELMQQLDGVSTVVVTGGNVAVLMSRLRLLQMQGLLRDKHLIAWSAGAMALCDRVVLYHDHAPQGQRDAEIFDFGMGLAHGLVVLPGAKRRLDTTLTTRLGLFSRRFAPRRCVTLDNASVVRLGDDRVSSARHAMRITRSGSLNGLRAR